MSNTGSEAGDRVASSWGGGGTLDRRWTLAGGSQMGWHFRFLERFQEFLLADDVCGSSRGIFGVSTKSSRHG